MILLNEKSELKNISNFFIFSDKNVFLKKSLLPGIDDFCSVLDFFYAYRIFIILPCCRALVVHAPSCQSSSQLTLTLCSMGFHSTWAKIAAKEIGM